MIFLLILFLVILLYLFMISPRLFHRASRQDFEFNYFAHRGLHGIDSDQTIYPENSMSAFKRALDNGFGMEFDVHLTKDDIPVVFHDDNLKRMCGVDAMLKDFTYEELQQFNLLNTDQKIPKFTDVLELVNGKYPLIIEYKVEGNANKLCSICDSYLAEYKGKYCIESFHPFAPYWYRKNRPEILRGQLAEDFMKTEYASLGMFFVGHLCLNFISRPDFISYNCKHKKELSRNVCKNIFKCHSVAWTVQSKDELINVKKDFETYIFETFLP